MKIYIAHTKNGDFQNELYAPIKNSILFKENEFILPHIISPEKFNSKDLFKTGCDLVIAEVSYPSTSLGIEMGWANLLNIPIVCVYRKGSKISDSLKAVTQDFFEYENSSQLIEKIEKAIKIAR